MSTVQADEQLLTTSEVAHLLKCHPSAPIRWIQRGSELSDKSRLKLQAIRSPGGWRISRAALDAFLQRLTDDRAGKPDAAPQAPPKSQRVARMNTELANAGLV
jgi:excisionase family DNA binding protein